MPPFVRDFFLLGCIGGLLPDVIRIIKGRYRRSAPTYLREPMFWVGLFLLAALGGFTAWVLDAGSAKQALAYGFASPELISKIASSSVAEANRGPGSFFIREWWGS